MKKSVMKTIITVAGLLLVVLGIWLMKNIIKPQGIMKVLPYLFIGCGCGIFGHGLGEIISSKVIKRCPDIEKEIHIEKYDERNVAISNCAKAKAYNMMIFLFAALMLVFALMGVDTTAIIIFVFAYLFVIIYGIYYRFKFEKKM